jgi:hypothetical protein
MFRAVEGMDGPGPGKIFGPAPPFFVSFPSHISENLKKFQFLDPKITKYDSN